MRERTATSCSSSQPSSMTRSICGSRSSSARSSRSRRTRKAGIRRHVPQPGKAALAVVLAIATAARSRRRSSPDRGPRGTTKTGSSAAAARTPSTTRACRSTRKGGRSALTYSARSAQHDRAPVRRLAAVLPGEGPVRHEDLERNRSGHRQHNRVADRRVGRSCGHDESGWTAVRIRRRTRRTSAAASRRANGRATTLVAYTTHIKAGALRRNGAPSSDEATMTTHFIRHGDILTVLEIIDDPIYLTEPELVSKSFQPDTTACRRSARRASRVRRRAGREGPALPAGRRTRRSTS